VLRRLRAMLPTRTAEREGVALAKGFAFADSVAGSRRIAYTDEMKVVVSLPDGREWRELFRDEQRQVSCPLAWSPDGRTLYHAYDQIYAIDAVTGVARAVTEFAESERFSVVWFLTCSPDGRRLLFLRQSPAKERVALLSLWEVPTDGSGLRMVAEAPPGSRLQAVDVQWPCDLLAVALVPTQWGRLLGGTTGLSPGAAEDGIGRGRRHPRRQAHARSGSGRTSGGVGAW
jgi:hypothetical protein